MTDKLLISTQQEKSVIAAQQKHLRWVSREDVVVNSKGLLLEFWGNYWQMCFVLGQETEIRDHSYVSSQQGLLGDRETSSVAELKQQQTMTPFKVDSR